MLAVSNRHKCSRRSFVCQLTDWDKEKAYNEDPLSYIHYTIEWKVTVNNRMVSKDTEQDVVLAPSAYWGLFLKPKLEKLLCKKLAKNRPIKSEDTNVVVSVTERSQRDLTKRFDFRSNPANKGKVCDGGLFPWTRHPNYFGEIIMQFSIFMIALSPSAYGYISDAYTAQYSAIIGPIFLTVLLLFMSGLTLQERPGAKKWYESGQGWELYKRWTERTSILIRFHRNYTHRCRPF
jgi:hypothetical protein